MNKYFLLLAQINGLGSKALLSLEAHFSDLSDCFKLSLPELKALRLSDSVINQIRNPNWSLVEKALAWSYVKGKTLLTWHDKAYPILLKEISLPPPLLYLT